MAAGIRRWGNVGSIEQTFQVGQNSLQVRLHLQIGIVIREGDRDVMVRHAGERIQWFSARKVRTAAVIWGSTFPAASQ